MLALANLITAIPTAPLPPNTKWIEVRGSGTPECDGLYCPSKEAAGVSESGTKAEMGYWNGRMAWDRVDGKAKRSPSLSFSNSYQQWRVALLNGHLAYSCPPTSSDLPPTDKTWDIYPKKGAVGPAPSIITHDSDPRQAIKDDATFNTKPNVVFVLGGPGAGKGTVCELAQNQLGWCHLSAGDLLRAERASGGKNADLIESYIVKGAIVPVEITVGLLRREMVWTVNRDGRTNFLIDGFPRNVDNVQGWDKVVGADANVAHMLYFECPLSVLEERILKRAKYSGRSDDNVESLRKRFTVYKEETMPVVEAFKLKGGNMCIEVDTSKAKVDVYDGVKPLLAKFTDPALAMAPLTERSEMVLGLRPYPPRKDKK